jgi:parallel beta-helix repeat protein
MKGIKKAQLGIITVLAAMLVSITRRLPVTRKLSSGITTLTLAGIVLLVVAGGASAQLPACPAPGDTVITTSCELDANWTVTAGQAGYTIGADGIIIDGAGYTITGAATPADCESCCSEAAPCTVSGIYNAGFDDVVIKNLEIKNFCTGIALAGTGTDKICNNTIDNCEIHDNGFDTGNITTHGIHACNIDGAVDEPALTITNNDVHNNEGTGSGCGAGGNGIFIYAGTPGTKHEYCNISYNNLYNNATPGTKHEYCNISYNNLYNNAKAGFWTKKALDQSKITHNEVWGNGNGAGITDTIRGGIILKCKNSNRNDVSYNNIHDHTAEGFGYGIYVGGSNNTIEHNTVTNNTMHGISMARGDGSFDNELYQTLSAMKTPATRPATTMTPEPQVAPIHAPQNNHTTATLTATDTSAQPRQALAQSFRHHRLCVAGRWATTATTLTQQ